MTSNTIRAMIALGAMGLALPLFAQGGKKLVAVTTTQQVPFQPGGTIHLDHSRGFLAIEGWDRPEVELTVIKSVDKLYDAKEQAQADKRAAAVHVTAERRSDTEIEISTAAPHYSRLTHPFGSDSGVTLEYQIHVPRNTKLVIHHGTGDVLVSNVTADIEATGSAGDISLLLPEAGQYSIDAKCRVGTVSSDFDGDFRRRYLVGIGYDAHAAAAARKIYLRMGVGGITIKSSPPSAQPPVTTAEQ